MGACAGVFAGVRSCLVCAGVRLLAGLGLRSRGLENGLLSTDSGNGLNGFVRLLDAGGRIVRPWG
jgi:hypothetical protein